MRKNLLLSSAVLVATIAIPASTWAYGGGIGFPPGYYDNPHPKPGLVCELVTETLPNGREVTVPRCKVVRDETQGGDLQQRINDFIERVRKGGR